jgi:hypothetical protein
VRPRELRTPQCDKPSSEVPRVPKRGVPRSLPVVDHHRGAVPRRSAERARHSARPTARSRDGSAAQGSPTSVSCPRSLLDRPRDQTEKVQPGVACLWEASAYVLEVARNHGGVRPAVRIGTARYSHSGRPRTGTVRGHRDDVLGPRDGERHAPASRERRGERPQRRREADGRQDDREDENRNRRA